MISLRVYTFPVKCPFLFHKTPYMEDRAEVLISYIPWFPWRQPSSSLNAHCTSLWECILPSQSVDFISLSIPSTGPYVYTVYCTKLFITSVQTIWLRCAMSAYVTLCLWMLSRHCPSCSSRVHVTEVNVFLWLSTGRTSRELFDVIITNALKPGFFLLGAPAEALQDPEWVLSNITK